MPGNAYQKDKRGVVASFWRRGDRTVIRAEWVRSSKASREVGGRNRTCSGTSVARPGVL